MQFLNLIICELTKLKRSQALLMTVLCPLAVTALQLFIALDNGGKAIEKNGWLAYWQGATMLWYMLMFPLYIALMTSLLNAVEHKNSTWRFMAALPVKQWQFYLSKVVVAVLFIIASTTLLYLLTGLSVQIMQSLGFQGKVAELPNLVIQILKATLAALPIIVIGLTISWRIKNVIFPLALGVIMTIAATKAVRSESYWIYDPWTYHMIGLMVSDPQVKQQAIMTGGLLGLALLVISAWWINRLDVHH